MAREYSIFSMDISNESRRVLIVKDPSTSESLTFSNIKTIIAEQEQPDSKPAATVYTTEGYIWKTYPPDDVDNYYVYWFILAKDQGAADIANQLVEENTALQGKAGDDSRAMSE